MTPFSRKFSAFIDTQMRLAHKAAIVFHFYFMESNTQNTVLNVPKSPYIIHCIIRSDSNMENDSMINI